jgi:hypothetical protein
MSMGADRVIQAKHWQASPVLQASKIETKCGRKSERSLVLGLLQVELQFALSFWQVKPRAATVWLGLDLPLGA